MKYIRKYAVIALVLFSLSGCAGLTSFVNGLGGFITNTVVPDVCAAASYYTTYVQGVVNAITLFPVVSGIVGPYVALANTAIAQLNADCQSGALTSKINADLASINGYIAQINAAVGNAQSAGLMK